MSKEDCSLDKSSFEGFFGRIEDNTHSERDVPLMTSCASSKDTSTGSFLKGLNLDSKERDQYNIDLLI